MPWLQMKLDIQPDQASAYEELLLALGSCAVTLEDGADQPLFEPDLGSTPLWDKTRITGLFDAEADLAKIQTGLQQGHQQIAPSLPFPACKTEILEDKDWVREWMDSFHPMQFGQRLWVCPSWKDVPDPSAANLMLDPGLAFGTGTHPTTALCLEWLDKQDCQDKLVIDYGCGSGILGIAALLLGATKLLATDIDPQALQATQANADRNTIDASQLELCYPDKMPNVTADILVANILAGPLVELAPTLAALVKPDGFIALSGVLQSQVDELIEAYAPWFTLEPVCNREEWIRLTGIRNQK
ncbi:50S ribosomal protein L11 methyltransferase [Motiliproteus sp. MSK22-1]|uniref:50S ribosomal protein L11 methyltransferase n=1 Tax=Motiliproteus sp. MSK22-1 TaxID=1897630 RepID=UPI0009758BB7|nr:50S ribosomal protein L11 methyltransferase [Motiliproteus sp. MSK22-1]OMH30242.1 ribosomal protein L11 methyltransferase [Motiliproteus sp. MSK22-1]